MAAFHVNGRASGAIEQVRGKPTEMLERPYKLRGDLKFLQDIGENPDAILAHTDLSLSTINRLSPLPRMSLANAYGRLTRMGGAQLAVRCGEAIRPRYLGALGFHLMNSSTVQELLVSWSRYSAVIGYPLQSKLRITERDWRLEFWPRYALDDDALCWCIFSTLAGAMPSLSSLSGHDIVATGFGLPFNLSDCRHMSESLGAPCSFDEPCSFVSGNVSDLDRIVLTVDPEVQATTEEYFLRLLSDTAGQNSVGDRVMQRLHQLPVAPGIVEMAASLNISQRTLQRRLAIEGESYSGLLDGFRREKAFSALRQGACLKHISHSLGFADSSAFRRSFRQWTGTTPSAWRSQHQCQPPSPPATSPYGKAASRH